MNEIPKVVFSKTLTGDLAASRANTVMVAAVFLR
jgi:hypothetical protein